MRKVTVKVESDNKDKKEDFSILLQSRRDNGVQVIEDSFDVTSGTPEAEKTFMIRDNQSIVVEARGVPDDVILDRDNNAAIRASQQRNEDGKADKADPNAQTPQQKQEFERLAAQREADLKAKSATTAKEASMPVSQEQLLRDQQKPASHVSTEMQSKSAVGDQNKKDDTSGLGGRVGAQGTSEVKK